MDFHADDDFPIASGAGNEAFRIRRTNVDKGHEMLFLKLFFSSGEVKEMAFRCKAFGTLRVPASRQQRIFWLLTASPVQSANASTRDHKINRSVCGVECICVRSLFRGQTGSAS